MTHPLIAAARYLRGRSAALLITCLALLLSGCASLAPQPAGVTGTAPAYQDTIELGGRLSVRYQQNGKEEALHGSFTWSQAPQRLELVLLTPLGQILARIEVTPAAATLTQANQPPRVAADIDVLASQALGWPLPVAGLRHWLQGYARSADGQLQAVPRAPNAVIVSDGWRIEYASWQAGDRAAAPKRIDLERQDSHAGPVALRIVLDQWQPR